MRYNRVALFMDFENFYTSQRKRTLRNPYGERPRLDFLQLVQFVEKEFGPIAIQDFIAAANFSHYDRQEGGLNKVATIVDLDTFLPRQVRQKRQRHSGKQFVHKQFTDMYLAFLIGEHAATNPADLYILATSDGDFAAVASALEQRNLRVCFLVPDEKIVAAEIRERYPIYEAPNIFIEPEPAPEVEPEPETVDPVATVKESLGMLRQQFSAGIPLDLLRAILPPEHATDWINKAYGEGHLDQWESPNLPGVTCVSLRSERLQGQIVPIPTARELASAGRILAVLIQHGTRRHEDSPKAWRNLIKESLSCTSRQAKAIWQLLTDCHLLDPAYPTLIDNHPKKVLRFVEAFKKNPPL